MHSHFIHSREGIHLMHFIGIELELASPEVEGDVGFNVLPSNGVWSVD